MIYGDLEIYGILSLFTAEDYLQLTQSDNEIFLFDNKVLSSDNTFTTINHDSSEKKSSRIPDFRQTLFWNPEMIVNVDEVMVEFYTSDLRSTFEIVVRGISKDGHLISTTALFNVK